MEDVLRPPKSLQQLEHELREFFVQVLPSHSVNADGSVIASIAEDIIRDRALKLIRDQLENYSTHELNHIMRIAAKVSTQPAPAPQDSKVLPAPQMTAPRPVPTSSKRRGRVLNDDQGPAPA